MKNIRRAVCTLMISVMMVVSFAFAFPENTCASAATPAINQASLQVAALASKTVKVYYTPKGKKYHRTKNCRTLKRSKKICSKRLKSNKIKKSKKCKVCWG